MSSSPPKVASGWPSLNPAHKKGTALGHCVAITAPECCRKPSVCVCLSVTAVTTFSPTKSKRQKKYRSVISDVFDGTIVSSVQCLTCDRVSSACSHVVLRDKVTSQGLEERTFAALCESGAECSLTVMVTFDRQVSVTLENFQDISLPIPGKEDLAKLHSSTHQTSLVKAGSCGEAYAPQGWIAFVMEYIKRCVDYIHQSASSAFDTLKLLLIIARSSEAA